jgi:hypothetical protein
MGLLRPINCLTNVNKLTIANLENKIVPDTIIARKGNFESITAPLNPKKENDPLKGVKKIRQTVELQAR